MALPDTISSWTTNLDGIPNLTLTTTPLPSPTTLTPTQVLVRIHAISLNYKDAEIVNGLFTHHKSSRAPANLIPCADSAGVIAALPASPSPTNTWTVHAPVLSVSYPSYLSGPAQPTHLASGVGSAVNGCLTTYRVFEASALVACPAHLANSPVEASCLPIAGTTAWMGLRWPYAIDTPNPLADRTLLVQGTGGVSIIGLLLARAHGMRVIVTSSSDEKLRRARDLIVDGPSSTTTSTSDPGPSSSNDDKFSVETINYRTTPAWDAEVLRLTTDPSDPSDAGADIIFENGGASGSTARSFRCVRFGGVINSIGYVAGKTDHLASLPDDDEERLNVNVLALARNVTVKGMLNGPRDRFEEMLRFVEAHQIRPVVDRVFPFDQAREAMQYLWDGKHFGKVVIKVGDV